MLGSKHKRLGGGLLAAMVTAIAVGCAQLPASMRAESPAAGPAGAPPQRAAARAALPPSASERSSPEASSGFAARPPVTATRFMAATANSLATQVAHDTLQRGGTAVDAAIAAQMVLALVEPQSSGLGGGAFLMLYDAATDSVHAFDGRETAPAAASERLFIGADGKPLPFYAAVVGGRSVGVPGAVAMLHAVHARSGRLPWASLIEPAIGLAEQGFAVSPRLHTLLATEQHLKSDPVAARYFYDAAGAPHPTGHLLRNPELAATLRAVAADGPGVLTSGPIAAEIVARVRTHPTNPGLLTEADLAAYRPAERTPVCGPYLVYVVCGMPPPSSGGIAVLQMLSVLQARDAAADPAPLVADGGTYHPVGAHRFAEAGRLAFADRNRFIADPDFVAWPRELLARGYLAGRATMIDDARAMGVAQPGQPAAANAWGTATGYEERGTSHLSVIDAYGNAVALTTTIEDQFGARLMVRGFLLNNQLTDFSFAPSDDAGPIANRVEPGKRPRSSMAPTLVFERRADGARGRLVMTMGSPGGASIINYVARTLVATLRDGLDMQTAIALPNLGNRNGPTELEKGRAPQALIDALAARGHEIRITDMTSGLQGILVRRDAQDRTVLLGGADPRREGLVMGQ